MMGTQVVVDHFAMTSGLAQQALALLPLSVQSFPSLCQQDRHGPSQLLQKSLPLSKVADQHAARAILATLERIIPRQTGVRTMSAAAPRAQISTVILLTAAMAA
jgi:hypothetical protein